MKEIMCGKNKKKKDVRKLKGKRIIKRGDFVVVGTVSLTLSGLDWTGMYFFVKSRCRSTKQQEEEKKKEEMI